MTKQSHLPFAPRLTVQHSSLHQNNLLFTSITDHTRLKIHPRTQACSQAGCILLTRHAGREIGGMWKLGRRRHTDANLTKFKTCNSRRFLGAAATAGVGNPLFACELGGCRIWVSTLEGRCSSIRISYCWFATLIRGKKVKELRDGDLVKRN